MVFEETSSRLSVTCGKSYAILTESGILKLFGGVAA